MAAGKLYYGDNLEVLRRDIADESVDLVYLDPPFNSARNYNVIFRANDVHADASAQIEAFGDTWHWTPETAAQFDALVDGGLPLAVADTLSALRLVLGQNDGAAYLVNMAPRLVELHRVLRDTGSIWLHCDPTMSHYLRVLLDSIFGAANFRNEVIWQRTLAKSYQTRRLPSNHDVILSYTKGKNATWNSEAAFIPYARALPPATDKRYSLIDDDGRRYTLDSLIGPDDPRPNLTYEFLGITRRWRWSRDRMQAAYGAGLVVQTAPGKVPRFKRYLDEQRGLPLGDVWTDIPPINSQAAERLGYPTQKPLALLERIIKLSSNPGDVVLDPFAGCGTSIDAAQKLGRAWVGIDVTYIAIDLIEKRLDGRYGTGFKAQYEVAGIPRDLAGAQALFRRDPFDFERWAVSRLDAAPNDRSSQRGDKGVDGVARFPLGVGASSARKSGEIIVSVKGGKSLGPAMVRDLAGAIAARGAQLGVLITLHQPTKGMVDAANSAGYWAHPSNGQIYPLLQLCAVADLLEGRLPNLPPRILPYLKAQRLTEPTPQPTLLP